MIPFIIKYSEQANTQKQKIYLQLLGMDGGDPVGGSRVVGG